MVYHVKTWDSALVGVHTAFDEAICDADQRAEASGLRHHVVSLEPVYWSFGAANPRLLAEAERKSS